MSLWVIKRHLVAAWLRPLPARSRHSSAPSSCPLSAIDRPGRQARVDGVGVRPRGMGFPQALHFQGRIYRRLGRGFVIAFAYFEVTFYRYAKRYEAVQNWGRRRADP